MAFDQFPYSNFHELNADWMLQQIKSAADRVEAALAVIGGVESQIKALQNADSQLRQEISAINASLSQMGTVLSRHTSEITSLQQADASLQSDLQNVRTELGNTILRLEDVEASVYAGLWPALAERYTAYETYNVGDVVYASAESGQAPKLWRCVTAHTGPVAFDPTKWQAVTMVELLDMVSATTPDDVTDLFTVTGVGPYYLQFAPSNTAALAARMNAHRICYIHYLTTHFIVKSVEYRDGAGAPQNIEVYLSNTTSVTWNFNGTSSTTPIDPTNRDVLATQTYVNNRALPAVTDADNGKAMQVVNGAWSAKRLLVNPSDMITSEILCPDFSRQVVQGRSFYKQNNVFYIRKSGGTNSNGLVVAISGSSYTTQNAIMSEYVADANNLIEISLLNTLQILVYNKPEVSEYTSYITIWQCVKNGDSITYLKNDSIALDDAVNKITSLPVSAHANATHFALLLYTRQNQGLNTNNTDTQIVINFV